MIFASQMLFALMLGTTRGTSFSYLNAEELSITTAHFFTAIGANSFELSHQAENKAYSSQLKNSSFTSCISIFQKGVSIIFQADLFDAQSLSSEISISKSFKQLIISTQTAQVAQTIQTFIHMVYI